LWKKPRSLQSASEAFCGEAFIKIRSDVKYVAPVRSMVDAVCSGSRFTEQDRDDLKLAVGEAVCNAIQHGSPNGRQDYVCIACAIDGTGIEVKISESGRFVRKRDNRRLHKLPEKGYGLLLIKGLTDAFHVRSGKRGAIVTMERRFHDIT
jgi:anti-sigma regulatory factor (Ser/Thr protein kinase)